MSNKVKNDKQTRSLFIVNKDGFMVPCTFYIDIVFPQYDDFLIGAVLVYNLNNQNKVSAIIDHKFNIASITEDFYKLFTENQKNPLSVNELLQLNINQFLSFEKNLNSNESKIRGVLALPSDWEHLNHRKYQKNYYKINY